MSSSNRLRPRHLDPIDNPDGDEHQGEGGGAADEGEEGEKVDEEVIEIDEEARQGESPAARPRVARGPREPTSQERALHEITHIPLRTWCRHCMWGRSKDC